MAEDKNNFESELHSVGLMAQELERRPDVCWTTQKTIKKKHLENEGRGKRHLRKGPFQNCESFFFLKHFFKGYLISYCFWRSICRLMFCRCDAIRLIPWTPAQKKHPLSPPRTQHSTRRSEEIRVLHEEAAEVGAI